MSARISGSSGPSPTTVIDQGAARARAAPPLAVACRRLAGDQLAREPDAQLAAGRGWRSALAAANVSVSAGQTPGQIRRGSIPCRMQKSRLKVLVDTAPAHRRSSTFSAAVLAMLRRPRDECCNVVSPYMSRRMRASTQYMIAARAIGAAHPQQTTPSGLALRSSRSSQAAGRPAAWPRPGVPLDEARGTPGAGRCPPRPAWEARIVAALRGEPVADVHPEPGLGGQSLERAYEVLGWMVEYKRGADCPLVTLMPSPPVITY